MSLKPSEKTEVRRDGDESLKCDGDEGLTLSPSTASVEKAMEDLRELVTGVFCDDPSQQLESVTKIKTILSTDKTLPIDKLIESGIVPRFIEFLKKDDSPSLQREAAWIVTYIASGTSENTKVVIEKGAVPVLIKLLASPEDDIREQALRALGNICSDSTASRDIVLQCGVLVPLLSQMNEHSTSTMLRTSTRTLFALCHSKPQPPFDQIKTAIPVLARLIRSKDEEILENVCWTLSDLCYGTYETLRSVIEAGVVPRLVELLEHPSTRVVTPVVRTIGIIVCEDTEQTKCVISALPVLAELLTKTTSKEIIKREACWTIFNICEDEGQIQAVIDANLFPILIDLAQNATSDTKGDAVRAIANATSGSYDQIMYLLAQGCIKPMCDLLVSSDIEIVSVCLTGLENILTKITEVWKLIADAKGEKKIESLLNHENEDIKTKAEEIMYTYFL